MTIDDWRIPEDAGEYRAALAGILLRITDDGNRYISVGPGWYRLIVDLDAQLAAIDPDYPLIQVKQKFGGLRYYAHRSDSSHDRQAEFNAAIEAAERAASSTCEVCGAQPAQRCRSKHGLVMNLCAGCLASHRDHHGDPFKAL